LSCNKDMSPWRNDISLYKRNPTFLLNWPFLKTAEPILFFQIGSTNKNYSPYTYQNEAK